MKTVKFITLNTHSLIEKNYNEKLSDFIFAIEKEQPEIIALQEVNQTISAPVVQGEINGYISCDKNIIIKNDNHAFNIISGLLKNNIKYYWTWLPIKTGYDKYDEGISILSKSPIIESKTLTVSNSDDYNDWKTRKILGIRCEKFPDEWFFSVHYGWYTKDAECNSFQSQWNKTTDFIKNLKNFKSVWLMGDFNNPAEIYDEGYNLIKKSGWYDTYSIAVHKDDGLTVTKKIDGWQSDKKMRIDFILSNKKIHVDSSEVIFNGINYPVVSDHFGVIIKINKYNY